MSDVMQGIDEDVPFDHGVCDGLETACRSAASAIEGQTGSRASYVTTAMQEFRGRFSELFTANADVAKADATELANRLREVATAAADLQASAEAEQQRRETARQWKQEQEDRNWLEEGRDWFTGGEDPPVGPADPPPQLSVSPPVNGTRETPNPGSGGGGGGGTSSARPADLRSFATGSQSLDSALGWRPASLRSRLQDFAAQCRWGTLDASGVMTGFDAWLDANAQDVTWAQTVADAFAAAGGEGAISTLSDASLMAALQAAGVDATRDDIVIDPAIAVGNPPTTGYANDPVNTSTGNFIENELDLAFPEASGSLRWARTYNSFDEHVGAFGPGWSSACDVRLDLDDDGASLVLADGRHVVFPRAGEGWGRATGENRWLTREEHDGRTLLVATDNGGERIELTTSGTWLATTHGAGTRVEAAYDDRGRLVGLTHERGRSVALRWEGDRVVEAMASDGRRLVYGYDDAGRLTSARGPLGTRTYGWSESGLVDRVVDADGVVEAVNTYDDRRRVVTQRSPHGRLTRFAYLSGRVTVVSDEDGTRSNTWVSDGRGRVVGIVDAHDHRQSMAYDTHGNIVSATERDRAVTVNKYDDRGRLVRTVSPSGADVARGYDDRDRLVVLAAEGGTVSLEYAGDDRDPSVIVDPEGGRTEMVWRGGMLLRVTDPVGVTLDFEHDEHGDLVAVTDALGHTARIERDGAGRIVASVTPGGSRTEFVHDAAGTLLSRRDPDGSTWRFEHSVSGKVTAVVDPLGGRTVMERGEHGEVTRTTDQLGRATVRAFDDLGNLASFALPDGSTWRFVHDTLSQLVETIDPTGATWRRDYDDNGDLVATVGPDGTRRSVTTDRAAGTVRVDDGGLVAGTRFDPLGRPVASERVDGSVALATHDRCGRPVELVDPEGGLTLLRRDAAGKVVERVSPSGATTRYEHDARGLLVATVDPSGGRTTFERDADGRVVRSTTPNGEVGTTTYDACGRVVERRVPGRGTARYRYDAAGRLVSVSDPWSGRRRFVRDAAGQVVEAVNGVGGVTRYTYDDNGRLATITDPLGHVVRREWDAMGRCTAETDPLGRTTRAGYDAAGRLVWQEDPTGRRLGVTYENGRVASTSVDGVETCRFVEDARRRTLVLTDLADGGTEHRMEWDRRGLLVSRSRGDATMRWTYDADGHRTSMTTPDGRRTDYERDASGRLVAVEHPLLGRAVLERDAGGRVLAARAGGTEVTYEHRDGFVVGRSATSATGSSRTVLGRDLFDRVVRVDQDGSETTFERDDAGRLVERRHDGSVTTWRFDAAGRLLAETTDGQTREHTHDEAGQLLTVTDASGTTRHTYDAAGRRVRSERPDGSVREISWGDRGSVSRVTDTADGSVVDLAVDALGELCSIGGLAVHLDTAAPYVPLLAQLGDTSLVTTGALTGVGDEWHPVGRGLPRGDGAGDPWAPSLLAGSPEGVGIGAAGELVLAGLEWLGARVHDPSTRGFLSVDPLDPVAGTGWAGNPYAYAGNDPTSLVDPTGLRPVTPDELQAYIDANQGAFGAVQNFVDEHAYIIGGIMVVAGAALVFTGVGGVAGGMLMSAGIDTISQKYQNGTVNIGQVALSGALGAFPVTGVASRLPLGAVARGPISTAVTHGVVNGVVGGARDGAVTGVYNVATSGGPYTPGAIADQVWSDTWQGSVTGGIGGGAGGLADVGGQALASNLRADRLLSNADGTVVIGNQADTSVLAGQPGHVASQADNWHPNLTSSFTDRAIAGNRDIYEATNNTLTNDQFDTMINQGYDMGSDTYTYNGP